MRKGREEAKECMRCQDNQKKGRRRKELIAIAGGWRIAKRTRDKRKGRAREKRGNGVDGKEELKAKEEKNRRGGHKERKTKREGEGAEMDPLYTDHHHHLHYILHHHLFIITPQPRPRPPPLLHHHQCRLPTRTSC
jgi:hypothetical protein